MMRHVATILLAFAMAMAPVLAQAPTATPLVRTTLASSDGIVIGQPVQLHVEVLFPGEMPRPPLVKVPESPGAQTLHFETQAITIRDRIGDQDYVGQRFEFVIFPRRGGDIQVPAADITLLDRAGDPVGSAKGQQIQFSVTVPPGIDPSGPVLAASDVRVSEHWSPDPASATFRAGSAITRVIQRKATDVPALGMADFRFTAPEGPAPMLTRRSSTTRSIVAPSKASEQTRSPMSSRSRAAMPCRHSRSLGGIPTTGKPAQRRWLGSQSKSRQQPPLHHSQAGVTRWRIGPSSSFPCLVRRWSCSWVPGSGPG